MTGIAIQPYPDPQERYVPLVSLLQIPFLILQTTFREDILSNAALGVCVNQLELVNFPVASTFRVNCT